MIVQGIGRQQHSYPSHSIHFVLPGWVPAGLMIEEAVEEEWTKLTGLAVLVGEHILLDVEICVVVVS